MNRKNPFGRVLFVNHAVAAAGLSLLAYRAIENPEMLIPSGFKRRKRVSSEDVHA